MSGYPGGDCGVAVFSRFRMSRSGFRRICIYSHLPLALLPTFHQSFYASQLDGPHHCSNMADQHSLEERRRKQMEGHGVFHMLEVERILKQAGIICCIAGIKALSYYGVRATTPVSSAHCRNFEGQIAILMDKTGLGGMCSGRQILGSS